MQFALLQSVPRVQLSLITIVGNRGCARCNYLLPTCVLLELVLCTKEILNMKTWPWSISAQNFTCFGLTNYHHEIWIHNSYAQHAFINYHYCPNGRVLFCHHTKLGNMMISNVFFSTSRVKIKVICDEMPCNLMVSMLCDFSTAVEQFLVQKYQTTLRYNPEDDNIRSDSC
jgi:hypothetical protein